MAKKATPPSSREDPTGSDAARPSARPEPTARPRPPWKPLLLGSAATGALAATSYFPLGASFLILVSLAPLMAATAAAGPRRGAACGFVAGFVGCGVAFHWVLPLIVRFTNLPVPAAIPIFVLWLSWEGAYWALVGLAWGALAGRPLAGPLFVAAPVLLEHVWPRVFPWNFGNPVAELPLLPQIADLGGVALLSFLVVAASYAAWRLGAFARRRREFPIFATISVGILIAGSLIYGALRTAMLPAPEGELTAGLVHPTIPIEVKRGALKGSERQAELQREQIRKLLACARQGLKEKGPVDIVVMPEGLVALELGREWIGLSRSLGVPVIYGAMTIRESPRAVYNSMVLEDGGEWHTYHKYHLLLFGENIPLGEELPFIRAALGGAHSLTRGEGVKLLPLQGHQLGPLICYEAIIPSYVRRMVDAGAQLLVNSTEDGWYGWTGEPYQHLLLSKVRAIENRRCLLRCVNGGISAIVDERGRILAMDGSPTEPGFVRARVGLFSPKSVYTRWGASFVPLLALFSAAPFVVGIWRGRRTESA